MRLLPIVNVRSANVVLGVLIVCVLVFNNRYLIFTQGRRPGPPLDFDNIQNGQVLSGVPVVYVDVNDPRCSDLSEDTTIWIDQIWEGIPQNTVDHPGPGGIELWQMPLPTDVIPNGTHTLRIESGAGGAQRTVVFRNASWIQSTAPGVFNRTISANFFPAQAWTVTIDLSDGKRIYTGAGSTVNFVWDGCDTHGRLVPHEEYPVMWTLTLQNGKTATGAING